MILLNKWVKRNRSSGTIWVKRRSGTIGLKRNGYHMGEKRRYRTIWNILILAGKLCLNVQLGLNSEVCLNELGKKIINNNNWFKIK